MCFIRYNREQLLDYAKVHRKLLRQVKGTLTVLKSFNLLKDRNARGGNDRPRRECDTNDGVNITILPEAISTVSATVKTPNPQIPPPNNLETIIIERSIMNLKQSQKGRSMLY